MRGGKRPGAGRKRGPEKKRLVAFVLPGTLDWLNKAAALRPSLGIVIDELILKIKNENHTPISKTRPAHTVH